jgi:uncharacterized membrane protein YdjX (TVP38/TMEM64 family)
MVTFSNLIISAIACLSITNIDSVNAAAGPMQFSHSVLALVPPRSTTKKFVNLGSDTRLHPTRLTRNDGQMIQRVQVKDRLFSDMSLRGGATDEDAPVVQKNNDKKLQSTLVKVVLPSLVSILAILIVMNWQAIAAFDLKGELASKLDNLAGLGTKGLIMYVIGFMIWEITVGVTTPVETAAGMAFGLKNGIIVNAIGKTSGALIAFLLGRFVFKDFVEEKLEGNELMELVQDSIVKNPLRVALIWRFSFLPEQIKNLGLAVLPVKTWQFLSAVLLHGFPFTLLWSFLGAEMGLIVRGVIDKPSRLLKILMSGVYVFGFFISPTMVGLWVKGLRDEKKKKDAAAGGGK